MSFKSYAQAGQYSTYHIDIPIKAEINEDLRVAGNFAKQMERSQKYREKWANSYLSALNEKSNIERQNRDDNFEFLQDNFKRIYEGEQREFDGKLAELRRDQAEAANADPGFFDDLLPTLIKLAPKIMGMVAAGQAAHLEGQKQLATDILTDTGVGAAQLGGLQRSIQSGMFSDTEQTQIIQGFIDNHLPGAKFEDVQSMMRMTGEAQMHSNMVAFDNDLPRITQQLHSASMTGSGEQFDPSLPKWRGPEGQLQYVQEFKKYTQDTINSSWGNNSRETYSDTVNFGIVQKASTSIQNSIFNKANNTWERQAQGLTDQHRVNQWTAATKSGIEAQLNHWDVEFKKQSRVIGISEADARLNTAQVLGERVLKSNMTHDQWVQFRKGYDARKHKTLGQYTPRGGPVDDEFDRIGIKLLERSNSVQRVHTQASLNEQKKIVKQTKSEYNRIFETEGRVAANNFVNQAREMNWEHNPEMAKWLNGMVSSPAVSRPANNKTVEERIGIPRANFERAAYAVALEGLGDSAANNKLGAAGMKKLGSTIIAKDKILGHMIENWTAYERKYAGVYALGSESLLQQAAYDSYKVLRDGGALPIKNEDSKVPTELTEYNLGPGENDIINRTAEYRNLTQLKPNEYHPLYQSDEAQFKNYADTVARNRTMGGDVNAPSEYAARVNLHNMAAVKERAFELGITRDEAADQILHNLGYPDAITDPFTKKDAKSNSQILNRIYDQSKTTTNHGYAAGQAWKTGTAQPAPYTLGLSNMSATSALPATASTDATGFRDYDASRYSPEELALQDTIKFAEGTFSKDGYNTWAGFQKPAGYPTDFGMRDISTMHNWQTKFMDDGYTAKTGSAVMGAYQYKEAINYAKQAGLDPTKAYFNAESQDAMAQAALNNMGITAEALRANGLTDEYIDKLAPTWASFPNLIGPDNQGRVGTRSSFYGQGGKTAEALKQFYQQRLGVYNKRGWGTVPTKPAPGMMNITPKKFLGLI